MKIAIDYIVALGGNLPSALGDPEKTLRAAITILHSNKDITITASSRFYRTAAYPPGSGPDFANAAICLRSTRSPEDMLALLHQIEARFGRDREGSGRWQARPLDLDLIAADDLLLPDPATQDHWRLLPPDRQASIAPKALILPHPRMQDRDFVLRPLAEIAPGWRHPQTGRNVAEMLAELTAES